MLNNAILNLEKYCIKEKGSSLYESLVLSKLRIYNFSSDWALRSIQGSSVWGVTLCDLNVVNNKIRLMNFYSAAIAISAVNFRKYRIWKLEIVGVNADETAVG